MAVEARFRQNSDIVFANLGMTPHVYIGWLVAWGIYGLVAGIYFNGRGARLGRMVTTWGYVYRVNIHVYLSKNLTPKGVKLHGGISFSFSTRLLYSAASLEKLNILGTYVRCSRYCNQRSRYVRLALII